MVSPTGSGDPTSPFFEDPFECSAPVHPGVSGDILTASFDAGSGGGVAPGIPDLLEPVGVNISSYMKTIACIQQLIKALRILINETEFNLFQEIFSQLSQEMSEAILSAVDKQALALAAGEAIDEQNRLAILEAITDQNDYNNNLRNNLNSQIDAYNLANGTSIEPAPVLIVHPDPNLPEDPDAPPAPPPDGEDDSAQDFSSTSNPPDQLDNLYEDLYREPSTMVEAANAYNTNVTAINNRFTSLPESDFITGFVDIDLLSVVSSNYNYAPFNEQDGPRVDNSGDIIVEVDPDTGQVIETIDDRHLYEALLAQGDTFSILLETAFGDLRDELTEGLENFNIANPGARTLLDQEGPLQEQSLEVNELTGENKPNVLLLDPSGGADVFVPFPFEQLQRQSFSPIFQQAANDPRFQQLISQVFSQASFTGGLASVGVAQQESLDNLANQRPISEDLGLALSRAFGEEGADPADPALSNERVTEIVQNSVLGELVSTVSSPQIDAELEVLIASLPGVNLEGLSEEQLEEVLAIVKALLKLLLLLLAAALGGGNVQDLLGSALKGISEAGAGPESITPTATPQTSPSQPLNALGELFAPFIQANKIQLLTSTVGALLSLGGNIPPNLEAALDTLPLPPLPSINLPLSNEDLAQLGNNLISLEGNAVPLTDRISEEGVGQIRAALEVAGLLQPGESLDAFLVENRETIIQAVAEQFNLRGLGNIPEFAPLFAQLADRANLPLTPAVPLPVNNQDLAQIAKNLLEGATTIEEIVAGLSDEAKAAVQEALASGTGLPIDLTDTLVVDVRNLLLGSVLAQATGAGLTTEGEFQDLFADIEDLLATALVPALPLDLDTDAIAKIVANILEGRPIEEGLSESARGALLTQLTELGFLTPDASLISKLAAALQKQATTEPAISEDTAQALQTQIEALGFLDGDAEQITDVLRGILGEDGIPEGLTQAQRNALLTQLGNLGLSLEQIGLITAVAANFATDPSVAPTLTPEQLANLITQLEQLGVSRQQIEAIASIVETIPIEPGVITGLTEPQRQALLAQLAGLEITPEDAQAIANAVSAISSEQAPDGRLPLINQLVDLGITPERAEALTRIVAALTTPLPTDERLPAPQRETLLAQLETLNIPLEQREAIVEAIVIPTPQPITESQREAILNRLEALNIPLEQREAIVEAIVIPTPQPTTESQREAILNRLEALNIPLEQRDAIVEAIVIPTPQPITESQRETILNRLEALNIPLEQREAIVEAIVIPTPQPISESQREAILNRLEALNIPLEQRDAIVEAIAIPTPQPITESQREAILNRLEALNIPLEQRGAIVEAIAFSPKQVLSQPQRDAIVAQLASIPIAETDKDAITKLIESLITQLPRFEGLSAAQQEALKAVLQAVGFTAGEIATIVPAVSNLAATIPAGEGLSETQRTSLLADLQDAGINQDRADTVATIAATVLVERPVIEGFTQRETEAFINQLGNLGISQEAAELIARLASSLVGQRPGSEGLTEAQKTALLSQLDVLGIAKSESELIVKIASGIVDERAKVEGLTNAQKQDVMRQLEALEISKNDAKALTTVLARVVEASFGEATSDDEPRQSAFVSQLIDLGLSRTDAEVLARVAIDVAAGRPIADALTTEDRAALLSLVTVADVSTEQADTNIELLLRSAVAQLQLRDFDTTEPGRELFRDLLEQGNLLILPEFRLGVDQPELADVAEALLEFLEAPETAQIPDDVIETLSGASLTQEDLTTDFVRDRLLPSILAEAQGIGAQFEFPAVFRDVELAIFPSLLPTRDITLPDEPERVDGVPVELVDFERGGDLRPIDFEGVDEEQLNLIALNLLDIEGEELLPLDDLTDDTIDLLEDVLIAADVIPEGVEDLDQAILDNRDVVLGALAGQFVRDELQDVFGETFDALVEASQRLAALPPPPVIPFAIPPADLERFVLNLLELPDIELSPTRGLSAEAAQKIQQGLVETGFVEDRVRDLLPAISENLDTILGSIFSQFRRQRLDEEFAKTFEKLSEAIGAPLVQKSEIKDEILIDGALELSLDEKAIEQLARNLLDQKNDVLSATRGLDQSAVDSLKSDLRRAGILKDSISLDAAIRDARNFILSTARQQLESIQSESVSFDSLISSIRADLRRQKEALTSTIREDLRTAERLSQSDANRRDRVDTVSPPENIDTTPRREPVGQTDRSPVTPLTLSSADLERLALNLLAFDPENPALLLKDLSAEGISLLVQDLLRAGVLEDDPIAAELANEIQNPDEDPRGKSVQPPDPETRLIEHFTEFFKEIEDEDFAVTLVESFKSFQQRERELDRFLVELLDPGRIFIRQFSVQTAQAPAFGFGGFRTAISTNI